MPGGFFKSTGEAAAVPVFGGFLFLKEKPQQLYGYTSFFLIKQLYDLFSFLCLLCFERGFLLFCVLLERCFL